MCWKLISNMKCNAFFPVLLRGFLKTVARTRLKDFHKHARTRYFTKFASKK